MGMARAGVAAGYEVEVAGSGPSEAIALTVEVLAPGAIAATVEEVAVFADLTVLAVPTRRFRQLPGHVFAGKIRSTAGRSPTGSCSSRTARPTPRPTPPRRSSSV
jgi:hypothetical protein